MALELPLINFNSLDETNLTVQITKYYTLVFHTIMVRNNSNAHFPVQFKHKYIHYTFQIQ